MKKIGFTLIELLSSNSNNGNIGSNRSPDVNKNI